MFAMGAGGSFARNIEQVYHLLDGTVDLGSELVARVQSAVDNLPSIAHVAKLASVATPCIGFYQCSDVVGVLVGPNALSYHWLQGQR